MMKLTNQPLFCIAAFFSMLLFTSLPEQLTAQDVRGTLPADSLSLKLADSLATLKFMLNELQVENEKLRSESLQAAEQSALLAGNLEELKMQQEKLITFNDSLNRQISGLSSSGSAEKRDVGKSAEAAKRKKSSCLRKRSNYTKMPSTAQ